MRTSSILISGAVAVAVAGSASASLVLYTVDTFSTGATFGSATAGFGQPALVSGRYTVNAGSRTGTGGGVVGQAWTGRNASISFESASGSGGNRYFASQSTSAAALSAFTSSAFDTAVGTSTFGGGNWTTEFKNGSRTTTSDGASTVTLRSQVSYSASQSMDFSAVSTTATAFSFSYNFGRTGTSYAVWFTDINGVQLYFNGTVFTTSGSVSQAMQDGFALNGVFDYTRVTGVTLEIARQTAYNAMSGNYIISNFQALPAPGALALLGAAGLVSSRRGRG